MPILLVVRSLLHVLADPVLWTNALTVDAVATLVRQNAPNPLIARQAVAALQKAALHGTHQDGRPQVLVVEALAKLTTELAKQGSVEAFGVAYLLIVLAPLVEHHGPTAITFDTVREGIDQSLAPEDAKTAMRRLTEAASAAHDPGGPSAPLQGLATVMHQAIVEAR